MKPVSKRTIITAVIFSIGVICLLALALWTPLLSFIQHWISILYKKFETGYRVKIA
ncbi:MAG: hypothetical protein QG657_1319, partial [Acidobacteriota bacterium]|nr:hypothetical protein [Acidobacteriota bacterium]